jgi:alpha-D-xyloside xylohydrolase
VFILTRSGFAGIQRNAAAVWSGDIASRWDDLYHQISAGVSIGYAGLPNWTFDIGGFANEARYSAQKPAAADLEEWRELNLRWFQFGAFAPLFRSHGEFPLREIYNLAPQGSEVYDSLVWYDKLAVPAAALHLHGGGGYLSPRRHHHARPGDGLHG